MKNVKVTFESHLKEYKSAFDKAVAQAMSAIGRKGTTYARKGTPVDTGRLRNSITWATFKRQSQTYTYKDNKKAKGKKDHEQRTYIDEIGSGVEKGEVVIGTNVEYAKPIEEGSSTRHAAHMLRNAVANHADEWKNILETSMKAQGIIDSGADFEDAEV